MAQTDPTLIHGWMHPTSLDWLTSQASKATHAIEIGCWQGRSTRAIINGLPTHGTLTAIDDWKGDPTNPDSLAYANDMEAAYKAFLTNLEDVLHKVHIIRTTSVNALPSLPHNHFDFIFIDSNHTYTTTKQEILLSLPLLKPNGIISGHDYNHQGVKQAVNELLHPQKGPDSIWYAYT